MTNQIAACICYNHTIIEIVVGKHCCGHLFLRERNSSTSFDECFEEVSLEKKMYFLQSALKET